MSEPIDMSVDAGNSSCGKPFIADGSLKFVRFFGAEQAVLVELTAVYERLERAQSCAIKTALDVQEAETNLHQAQQDLSLPNPALKSGDDAVEKLRQKQEEYLVALLQAGAVRDTLYDAIYLMHKLLPGIASLRTGGALKCYSPSQRQSLDLNFVCACELLRLSINTFATKLARIPGTESMKSAISQKKLDQCLDWTNALPSLPESLRMANKATPFGSKDWLATLMLIFLSALDANPDGCTVTLTEEIDPFTLQDAVGFFQQRGWQASYKRAGTGMPAVVSIRPSINPSYE